MSKSMQGLLAALVCLAFTVQAIAAEEIKPYSFRSKHYIISTDVPKELSKEIGKHMDEVYEEYASRMSGFRAQQSEKVLELFVWSTYDKYLQFTASKGFNAANTGGVFYWRQAGAKSESGLATWIEGQSTLKMYSVLQHEGFHQFAFAKIARSLPAWVNEGLAEYFGDGILLDGKFIVGKLDGERLARMKRAIADHTYLDFDTLMTMDNNEWLGRVTSGAKESSLMYDMAWSVCYFLIHGDKGKYRQGLGNYLDIINTGQDSDVAFRKTFGPNLKSFEKAWTTGLPKMEGDAWYTSIRRAQFYAEILKQIHAAKMDVKSFPKLRELVIMNRMKATIRERDIVARNEKVVELAPEDDELSFPPGAQVELVQSDDPKLPHGLLVKGLKPSAIRVSFSIDENGVLVEDISYEKEKTTIKKPTPATKPAKLVAKKSPTTKPTTQRSDELLHDGTSDSEK